MSEQFPPIPYQGPDARTLQAFAESQQRFVNDLIGIPCSFPYPRTMKGLNLMTTPVTNNPTDALLAERGKTHGSFAENSEYAGQFLATIGAAQARRAGRYDALTASQLNALVMISQKMSRILSAPDAAYADNWDDIAGYAMLGKSGK